MCLVLCKEFSEVCGKVELVCKDFIYWDWDIIGFVLLDKGWPYCGIWPEFGGSDIVLGVVVGTMLGGTNIILEGLIWVEGSKC